MGGRRPTRRSPTVRADRHGDGDGGRRPQRARRRRRSPGRSCYRFHAGGFTSPAGRAAPAVAGRRRCKLAAGDVPALRDRLLRRPPRPRRVGARPRRVPRRLHLRGRVAGPVGDGRVRSHDGPEPTDLAGYRARYAQYLSDPDLQAARAACPWLVIWDDHEVENNYAGLDPAGPGRARRRSPPAALAAYQAWWEHMPVRLAARRSTAPTRSSTAPGRVRRPGRPRAARRPPVPQRPGVRRRRRCRPTRRAPRRRDPARTMLGADPGGVGRPRRSPRRAATWAVLGQQTVLTDLRLPNGGDPQLRPVGRLRAGPRPPARRGRAGRRAAGRADRRHPPRRRRAAARHRHRVRDDVDLVERRRSPPALQPILASFDDIVDAELRPPRLHPPHRDADRRGPPSTASSTTSPTRLGGRRRGARSRRRRRQRRRRRGMIRRAVLWRRTGPRTRTRPAPREA